MADKKKKKPIDETVKENEKTESEVIEEAENETPTVNKELEEIKDKFLRLAADFDNFKKRTAAEKDSLRSIVVSDTVQMMLPIIDNLERALAAATEDSPLKQGVQMTLTQAQTSFTAFGIIDFGQRGEDFNPELHNAVMTCQDPELDPNKIAAVLQKGYKIGDKIIRHALVSVTG